MVGEHYTFRLRFAVVLGCSMVVGVGIGLPGDVRLPSLFRGKVACPCGGGGGRSSIYVMG